MTYHKLIDGQLVAAEDGDWVPRLTYDALTKQFIEYLSAQLEKLKLDHLGNLAIKEADRLWAIENETPVQRGIREGAEAQARAQEEVIAKMELPENIRVLLEKPVKDSAEFDKLVQETLAMRRKFTVVMR
jgi:hypothetical protein